MLVTVVLLVLKESQLFKEASDHQKLKVPGPVTVVCTMDVWEAKWTVLLCAADTPS